MTCINIPDALIFIGGIVFIVSLGVSLIMYLDGYWEPERVYRRWLMGDSFTAIDERHALGINRDGTKRNRK